MLIGSCPDSSTHFRSLSHQEKRLPIRSGILLASLDGRFARPFAIIRFVVKRHKAIGKHDVTVNVYKVMCIPLLHVWCFHASGPGYISFKNQSEYTLPMIRAWKAGSPLQVESVHTL